MKSCIPKRTSILAVLGFLLTTAWSTPPSWWGTQEVLDATQNQNNYAAITVGQLKNIAVQAMEEMDVKFPGGAGAEIHAMVDEWRLHKAEHNQYSAAVVGQVKQVAKPFYDRLSEAGQWPANTYPWESNTPVAENYAIANIGQVKNLFQFEIPNTVDADNDGLPDAWEQEHFGDLDQNPDSDLDGDGLSNLQEYEQGSDPSDFFNNQPAVLTIVNGNNQTDFPGSTLAQPLSIRVSNQMGNPKSHAIVLFAMISGGGTLSPSSPTDSNGITSTTLQLPLTEGATIVVRASFGGVEETFTATVAVNPGDPSAPPAAPSDVSCERQSASAIVIRWKDNANNETAYYVERSEDNKVWTRLMPGLPANTTEFVDHVAGEFYSYRIVSHNEAP